MRALGRIWAAACWAGALAAVAPGQSLPRPLDVSALSHAPPHAAQPGDFVFELLPDGALPCLLADDGTLAGAVATANGATTAFVQLPAQAAVRFALPAGVAAARPLGLADHGRALLLLTPLAGPPHGVLWTPGQPAARPLPGQPRALSPAGVALVRDWRGTLADLLVTPEGRETALPQDAQWLAVGQAVNAAGHVAGKLVWRDGDGFPTQAAILLDGRRWTPLGTLPGLAGGLTSVVALNDADVLLASASPFPAAGSRKAFAWSLGTGVVEIPVPDGASDVDPVALSNANHVLVRATYSRRSGRRGSDNLLFTGSAWVALPAPPHATWAAYHDVNAAGELVGTSDTGGFVARPVGAGHRRVASGPSSRPTVVRAGAPPITTRPAASAPADPSGDVAATDYQGLLERVDEVAAVTGDVEDVTTSKAGTITTIRFTGVATGGFKGIVRQPDRAAVEAGLGGDLPAVLKGRRVRLTGTVTLYRGAPVIEVRSAAQVTVLAP